jgi:hypothetical protein
LNLAIGLPLRNEAALDTLLAQLADPTSSQHGHYLTAAQFAAEFGPTEQDYQAMIHFAENSGLTVTATHPNRLLLDVSGDVQTVESAFRVRMMNYKDVVRGEYFAPDREPTVEAAALALDITGLDNYELPHPMNLKSASGSEPRPYVTGSGPAGLFIGQDFRAAYANSVTLNGSGQVVGLLEFDGFYPGDVTANAAQAGVVPVSTQTVLLDGFNGVPGANNTEVILDIMMASYMAPKLAKEIVYEGEIGNDILNRMATDNQAQQLSSSWGFGGMNATTQQIFKEYVAQGQTMFQASGDSGAYAGGVGGLWDDPNITVVGGTSLTTAGAGGPWQAESAWSGSGGGISTYFPIPAYQQWFSMAASHGSTTMRNIPDVALTADVQIFLIQSNGQAIRCGGTSAAAPLWAGFVALANQQAVASGKPRIGFLNTLLSSIGTGSNYSSDINDIKSGNNAGYSAVTGYDLATGWGSPAGQHLINDLTGATGAASFSLGTSASALTIRQGGSGSSTLTVNGKNSFNGAVGLSASGVPSGVTAAFALSPTYSSSTVTFSAGTAAAGGTYPITITGVSGSLSSTTSVAVTIVVPSFTLSASTGSLTLPRSTNGSTTISVGAVNGFNNSVALATAGLPTGVGATFSPATTTTASILTFTASNTAAAGTYLVAVTGTSGTLKTATTVTLVVTTPGFLLSFSPASLSLPRGQSAASTVALAAQGGFNSSVGLSVTRLPTGVTASFGALSPGGTSLLTLTANATATLGLFPITLHGVSGSLTNTALLNLTVIAPTAGTTFVNLSPFYNINALVADGLPFSGSGLDGGLNGSSTAYSGNLVGVQQTIAGMVFAFGPVNALDAVSAKTVLLPAGQLSGLRLLATGVNGAQLSQVFKVTYTDGTVDSFTQNLSDWFTPQGFTSETKALTMPYRDNAAGHRDNRTFYLYEYTLALTPGKTVASLTLPANRNVVVLAADLTNAAAVTR